MMVAAMQMAGHGNMSAMILAGVHVAHKHALLENFLNTVRSAVNCCAVLYADSTAHL